MTIPVLTPRPFSLLYAEDGSFQTKHVLQGRKYEAIFGDEDVPIFQKYWACYQLRQPSDAPMQPISVCKKMPFFSIEAALKHIEDQREHYNLDFNDNTRQKGVIYSSAIELARARFAGKVTFKPLVP